MMHHQTLYSKIKSLEALKVCIQNDQAKGLSIVFTNGCFDLLHKGHVDYLSKAADLGDKLIVAVNTDDSVRRLGKSASRPIQDQEARATVIAALESVAYVVLFNEDTPFELIQTIAPNVLVKGSDYAVHQIVGADIVLANGGRVETIDFIQGYSTSAIEQKILKG
jgi:rfaE bifunctional protein nucleotidyltransferase chain/domain